MEAGASLRGLDEAVGRLRARGTVAARVGCLVELEGVVAAARASWPRDTGASSRQLVVRATDTGGRLDLTGYAVYVRRSGSSRLAVDELVVDRIDPVRAGARIAEEVTRG